jgi:hypothetical protein
MPKYSIEEMIKDFHEVKQKAGKITQDAITEHGEVPYKQAYNYFDSFEYVKLEVNIYESDYLNTQIQARDDYEPILLRLMKECEKEHGKVTRNLIKEDENMPKVSAYRREFDTLTTAKMKAGLNSENNVIQFTGKQLEQKEDEMIELMNECNSQNKIVTKDGIDNMDSYIASDHIIRHFGSFTEAKQEALDDPNFIGVDVDLFESEEILQMLRDCEEKYGYVDREVFCSEYVSRSRVEKHFGTFSNAKVEAGLQNTGTIQKSEEELEDINQQVKEDDKLQEVIKGLLLGDGSLEPATESESCFRVGMANREFLRWLYNNYLHKISNDIRNKCTPKEGAEQAKKSGFRPDAKEENYSHIYEIRTHRLPFLSEMREKWYPDEKKRFPEDLELTPTSAKFWYCGDGGVNIFDGTCSICCKNESERPRYLEHLFQDQGFNANYVAEQSILFGQDSERFLEWIGECPKGFEYKWELDNRGRYYKLKQMSEKLNKREYFEGVK